jgi:AmmeMemoRadiSam system protein A
MSAEDTRLDAIGPELANIARRALRAHLGTPARSWRDEVDDDAALPKLPVFVTLRTSDGELRGCIGSLEAQEANVALETARIAVLSATEDPRFARLDFDEIDGLGIEVSVLLPEERFDDPHELDDGRHGVVVRHASGRKGVLLPGVPGIKNGAEQIAVARRKAGIGPAEDVTTSRFAVLKYS